MAELAVLIDSVIVHRFSLEKETTLIGRSHDCDITLDDNSVSSQHAKLSCSFNTNGDCENIVFVDLDSTNGSLINNQSTTSAQLKHNDVLSIGSTQFKVIYRKQKDTTTLLKPYENTTEVGHINIHLLDTLTRREIDVLKLMGQELQRKAIARELNLSVHTISDHIKVIYRKLEISSKAEAVDIAKHIKF